MHVRHNFLARHNDFPVETNQQERDCYTGVHIFHLECYTAMSVLVYYTLRVYAPCNMLITNTQFSKYRKEATGPQLRSKARWTRAKRIVTLIKITSWFSR
jgi:hypothetical protein